MTNGKKERREGIVEEGRTSWWIKGLVFILGLVLVWGAYRYLGKRKGSINGAAKAPTPTGVVSFGEKLIEEKTNLTVPDQGEKIILKDVTGGQGSAVARRIKTSAGEEISVTADLPELTGRAFYQAWLTGGSGGLSLGKLQIEKGGYLLEKTLTGDWAKYDVITVTEEKVLDNRMEKKVLEGSWGR